MSRLETELETYRKALPELLSEAGKFVLIRGQEVLGIYETYEDALKVGYDKCGLDPFLVKKIESTEQVQYFTRHIKACPT